VNRWACLAMAMLLPCAPTRAEIAATVYHLTDLGDLPGGWETGDGVLFRIQRRRPLFHLPSSVEFALPTA
jgi:hypothetical protein